MSVRKFAAAAVALAAPFIVASGARAATFFPATVQATCMSSCLDQKTKTYNQTIAASSFGGPVSIGAFAFNKALLGDDQTAVFHVTFWTADGHQVSDFGRYMVGSLAGDELILKGDSFNYDPSLGNLTMRIQLDDAERDAAGGGGGGFFGGGGGGGGETGRTPGGAFTPPGLVDNPGLGFTPPGIIDNPGLGGALQPVPEPGAWALMLLGFGGAGALLRSRRRQMA